MFDFWIGMSSVSIVTFILWMIVCAVVYKFVGHAAGLLLLAVVLYNVTVWVPLFDGQKLLFWLSVLGAIGAIIWWYLSGGRSGAGLAMGLAVLALVQAILLMIGPPHGIITPEGGVDVSGVSEKVENTSDDLAGDLVDIREKNKDAINEVRFDLTDENDATNRRVNRLVKRVNSLETTVNQQRGRLKALRDLLDDHIHERVGQPHYVDRR